MKKILFFSAYSVIAGGMFLSPARAGDASTTSNQVTIRSDISLEVVDWGGDGESLIFLAGLGHTAHAFDEFGPRFCHEYRVIGITRRGFGVSSCPESGYDLVTLAEDIKLVMDSLSIDKAVLVGHSIGGDEMTKFASLYPDRLRALIYLEGAYDRLTIKDSLSKYPEPESITPEPTENDLASVAAYREYYALINGVMFPESEFLAICEWNSDGSFKGWIAPAFIYKDTYNGLEHPAYSKINVPALAIYAKSYPITELFPDYAERDSLTQAEMMIRYDAGQRIERMLQDEFSRKVKKGKVVGVIGAGHSLYITHPEEVEKEMRRFLSDIFK